MTPLAAHLFRGTDIRKVKDWLAGAQFLECSAIFEMAASMTKDDPEGIYSTSAMLPAPFTCIEMMEGTHRVMFLCAQSGPDIWYSSWWVADPGGGVPVLQYKSGLTLGTTENAPIVYPKERPDLFRHALGANSLIEKLLCILNQRGLIDRVPRPTDKRVLRALPAAAAQRSAVWHECRIRPGRHGGDTNEIGPSMPLHYVRKYFRPSSGQWIDGYWRGDASLGVHFKWYSAAKVPPPHPARQREQLIQASGGLHRALAPTVT